MNCTHSGGDAGTWELARNILPKSRCYFVMRSEKQRHVLISRTRPGKRVAVGCTVTLDNKVAHSQNILIAIILKYIKCSGSRLEEIFVWDICCLISVLRHMNVMATVKETRQPRLSSRLRTTRSEGFPVGLKYLICVKN